METFYTSERAVWRDWLSKNFNSKKEIWLVYPKKSSGKQCIVYNDAVEEALCFGWIDSLIKTLDENNSVQKFTPRNPKSGYSQPNKERIKWLHSKNLLHPSVKDSVKEIVKEKFIFPEDILAEIKSNPMAWENYKRFSEPYKRIRIAWIDSARKRQDEFEKRLRNFIVKTEKNKLIGYGGIDKYF